MDEQAHQMYLDRKHPSGAEEWYCPTCGRRFLMKWPPDYEIIVLETGDMNARHSGTKGFLDDATQPMEIKAQTEDITEARLRPWIKAIESLDLNW